MIANNGIAIRNIYYMMAYAFSNLKPDGYYFSSYEKFDNALEMLGTVLVKGFLIELKRGLQKDYNELEEEMNLVRGKIQLNESIKNLSIRNQRLICSFDDYNENSYCNRIIKTTLNLLILSDISDNLKKAIKSVLVYLSNVDIIDVKLINWKLKINKNNRDYIFLISICNLILSGMIQNEFKGSLKLNKYIDDRHLERLYEKFILEFYRKECPEISARALKVNWKLDDAFSYLLPDMQTDITLSEGNNVLIIDAKFYKNMMRSNYGINKINSNHLYQIFTYVKNMSDSTKEVSGLLLYAKTNEEEVPNVDYKMSGNIISVKALDLNMEFSEIKNTLLSIKNNYLGKTS